MRGHLTILGSWGSEYLARHGSRHDVWTDGERKEPIPYSVALQLIDFMSSRHGTIAWDEVVVFETDEDVATYESLWSEIDRIAAAETDVMQRMQQAEDQRIAAVENLKEAVR